MWDKYESNAHRRSKDSIGNLLRCGPSSKVSQCDTQPINDACLGQGVQRAVTILIFMTMCR